MRGFPDIPISINLFRVRDSKSGLLIHDEHGIDAGANNFLKDVQRLRNGMLKPGSGRIAFLSASGYYFLVGFFAIAALGGTLVPLAPNSKPTETLGSLSMAEATYLLTEPNTIDAGIEVKEYAEHTEMIFISRHMKASEANTSSEHKFEIDPNLALDQYRPISVISISGTSGSQPKGVVVPRRTFFPTTKCLADPQEQYLAYRSVY
ncbi:hypothetical protein BDW69DRAFT_187979 [Aspergillus filifer]